MNRLEVLTSPEGEAIRARAKAAHQANEQEFKEKVDAIPGCVEAYNEWRDQLDEMMRLWSRYEEMVKPLRAELDANALRINKGMASTVGVTALEAEAICDKWTLDHEANRQAYEEKRKALPGCMEAWDEWRRRKDKQNKRWAPFKALIEPLREEMEANRLRINREECEALRMLERNNPVGQI
ncbi:hypothetical protein ES703_10279 [subsurface metagenome]